MKIATFVWYFESRRKKCLLAAVMSHEFTNWNCLPLITFGLDLVWLNSLWNGVDLDKTETEIYIGQVPLDLSPNKFSSFKNSVLARVSFAWSLKNRFYSQKFNVQNRRTRFMKKKMVHTRLIYWILFAYSTGIYKRFLLFNN